MYRYIPSDASRDLAFQSGELDMIYGRQDQTWVERTSKLPGVKVATMELAELSAIYLNTAVKPLDDIRVRQAIAHAIDRKAMVAFKGAGVSRPSVSIVPSGYLGTDEQAPLYPYDPEKAKKLLAEAGHPNGITIKTIHTTLPGMQSVIEAVQAQLKKAGINLDIELVEHATFHAQDPQGPVADRALSGGALPRRRHLSDAVLPLRVIVKTPTAVTNFTHCKRRGSRISKRRASSRTRRSRKRFGRPRRRSSSRRSAASRSTSRCRSGPTRTRSIWATS